MVIIRGVIDKHRCQGKMRPEKFLNETIIIIEFDITRMTTYALDNDVKWNYSHKEKNNYAIH